MNYRLNITVITEKIKYYTKQVNPRLRKFDCC